MTDSDLGVLCTVRSCWSWHVVFNRELLLLAARADAQSHARSRLSRARPVWSLTCTCMAQQLFGSKGPVRARMLELPSVLAARGSLPAWAVLAVETGRLAREVVLPYPACPTAPAPSDPQLPALECPVPYCPTPQCPTCPRCPSPPRLEAAAWSAAGAGGVQCVAWAAWKVAGCCRYARAASRVAPARRGAGVLA